MSFHPGQLVVCLKTWNLDPGRIEEAPVNGRIYTVADFGDDGTEPWIRVAELHNPVVCWGNLPEAREVGWMARYFHPITDARLQIFRSLLNPTPTQHRELEREPT